MDLACCHSNRYDAISALKVLPNNRVAKIFIVCLRYEISFFGIFHRFTNTIARKHPFEPPLKTIYQTMGHTHLCPLWQALKSPKAITSSIMG